jgi:hypothetical protein
MTIIVAWTAVLLSILTASAAAGQPDSPLQAYRYALEIGGKEKSAAI